MSLQLACSRIIGNFCLPKLRIGNLVKGTILASPAQSNELFEPVTSCGFGLDVSPLISFFDQSGELMTRFEFEFPAHGLLRSTGDTTLCLAHQAIIVSPLLP